MSIEKKIITPQEAGSFLLEAGWTGWRIPIFLAIGKAESGFDTYAHNFNTRDPQSPSYRTLDMGWMQLNWYWWFYKRGIVDFRPIVYDPLETAKYMYKVLGGNEGVIKAVQINHPTDGYNQWSTWRLIEDKNKPGTFFRTADKYISEMKKVALDLGVLLD